MTFSPNILASTKKGFSNEFWPPGNIKKDAIISETSNNSIYTL
jgi:hypothetical protein